MDAETKMLLETELRGLDVAWDEYTLSGFRLARVVIDRMGPDPARVAAEDLLVLFSRSGVPKGYANVLELRRQIEALARLVRQRLGSPRPQRANAIETSGTMTCAGCGKDDKRK